MEPPTVSDLAGASLAAMMNLDLTLRPNVYRLVRRWCEVSLPSACS